MSYLLFIPPGEFQMGKDETQPSDHSPAHTVDLDGFWIHQTEVTNRVYKMCVDLGICTPPYQETGESYRYANPAYANLPVVGVDWYQAETYCEWIGGRLPTEAQWEKAARGTQSDPYPWGNEEPACNLLNYDGDCFEPLRPVDVGSYPLGVSPFDLSDTAGNVSEWVYDWFGEDYYAVSSLQNPTGPAEGDLRVVRGSHYESEVEAIPLYLRSSLDPKKHNAQLGFRCVLTGEAVGSPPPRSCELPSYSLPEVEIEQPPEPYFPSVTALGYCIDTPEADPAGYVNLVFDQPVEASDYDLASSAGIVTVTQDSSQLDTLILSGPGIPLEQVFELTVCPVLPPSPMSEAEPICPTGYILDTNTGKCRYVELSENICAEGYAWLEGYGYVEVATDPLDQMVMVFVCALNPGYEIVELSASPLTLACLPVDGPTDCGTDQDCSTNTTCLPGTTYESVEDCCVYPPSFEPVCLAGYTYDPTLMKCIPEDPDDQCTSFFIYIPSCEVP
jgi:hypothetical protein